MFPSDASTVDRLHDLIERQDAAPAATRLPVHPSLSQAFPEGLRSGSGYALQGTTSGVTSVALALLAGPSQQGSWCAVVGLPDLGIEAAADLGVDLTRLILVPDPGPRQWSTTMSTLIEVADVIVTTPVRLAPAERSRLDSRLRTRHTALVVTGPWPRAVTVAVTTVRWEGLGQGHGALLRRQVRLDVTERHHTRNVQLTLPPPS